MDTFGVLLERARKDAGYKSAESLGKKIGVTHVTIRAWEKDEYKPGFDHLLKLIDILGKYQFITDLMPKSHSVEEASAEYLGHVDAWDSKTPLDEDDVEVPYYMDVELAAGTGSDVITENPGYKLRFSKSTLRRCNVDAASAACVKVSGNSMEPRLFDGDVVGVNTADKSVVDGKTYAINHDGMLRVKRLYRLPSGGLRVNSINSAEHPDESYTAEERQAIQIIGKVFWHSSIWD